MALSSREKPAVFVSRRESEELLTAIARQSAHLRAGIFGPDFASWRIHRESALFLGAGRAALLQLAHPWVAEALASGGDRCVGTNATALCGRLELSFQTNIA